VPISQAVRSGVVTRAAPSKSSNSITVELDHFSGVHLGAMQADAAWTPPRGVRRTTTSTGSTDVANGASNHVAAVRPPAPRPGA
jgi:hypothetical protein